MKILIVDDDSRIRNLIRSIIEDLAAEILECDDGLEASKIYAESLPDWVLMDLVMPKVDGVTAIRQIKKVDNKARIIVVTSYESIFMREEADQAGAFAYVLKDDLLELRNILKIT